MSQRFELSEGKVLVIMDDGRVKPSNIPEGVDPTTFRDALAVVDMLYRKEGVFPSVKDCHKRWDKISEKTYSKIYATHEFEIALANRGISMSPNKGLTPEQGTALLLLSNPVDRRTTAVKLKELGISMPKYQAWMRNPLFAETLRQRAEQNLGDSVAVALNRLVGNAEAGDQRAIEKLLEVTGRYNPANAELANARQLILTLINIIVRRVEDPSVKKAIMDDISDELTIVQHETKMLE